MRLFFTACSVTYIVISFDSEAGYHGTVAFSAYRTLPVSASISSAASVPDERAGVLATSVAAKAAATSGIRSVGTKVTGRYPIYCLQASSAGVGSPGLWNI